MDQTPHVALLPSPGMGHLIPFVEFAKQLVRHHHFSATILIPAAAPPTKAQKAVVQTLPETIKHIFLPPVDLPKDLSTVAQMSLTVTLSLSSLKDTITSFMRTTRLVALLVDPFGIDAFDVAKEFGVSKYLFFPTTAMVLQFCLHLPKLDEMVTCEYRDLPEPIKLSGCFIGSGRSKMKETGMVRREEIAEVVKTLMEEEEGKKVRLRMEGLKNAAAKALSEDGSSTKSLSELAFKWMNQKNL